MANPARCTKYPKYFCYNNNMNKGFFDQDWESKEEEDPQEKSPRSPAKRTVFAIIDFIKTTIIVVFLALIIRLFVVQPFIVEGQSMLPTFSNNDYLITEKISYSIRSPERGEIVIFHPPDNPSINYIKRLVGLPGDSIEVKDQSVYVNTQKINEPYLTSNEQTNVATKDFTLTLKSGEYFVLGDNRNHSRDSREIGPIPYSSIVSRVWVRLLPVDNVRAFAAIDYEGIN